MATELPGPKKWAYGVTTVPSRMRDLLPRTLASLRGAGFGSPTLFVDGCDFALAGVYEKTFNLPVEIHRQRILTFGNWMLALHELYIRNPGAERFAIFQDDIVTYRNLMEYLDVSPYPNRGYLNLHSHPINEALAPRDQAGRQKVGWHPSNQSGLGALALVFNNEAARQLLLSAHLVDRLHNKDRGWRAVDGAVVQALMNISWPEYVHHPSLTQHVGLTTTMGTPHHPESKTFQGEESDARELIPAAGLTAGVVKSSTVPLTLPSRRGRA
jgi:hypothetical protein